MNKVLLNTLVNFAMAIAFVVCFVTGLLKIPALAIHKLNLFDMPLLTNIHDLSGVVIGVTIIIHVFLHWRWFYAKMMKPLNTEKKRLAAKVLVVVVLLILVVLVFGLILGQSFQASKSTTPDNSDVPLETQGTGSLTVSNNPYEDTCPHGIENDPYPGECGQYIDKDNDGFCDRS